MCKCMCVCMCMVHVCMCVCDYVYDVESFLSVPVSCTGYCDSPDVAGCQLRHLHSDMHGNDARS